MTMGDEIDGIWSFWWSEDRRDPIHGMIDLLDLLLFFFLNRALLAAWLLDLFFFPESVLYLLVLASGILIL